MSKSVLFFFLSRKYSNKCHKNAGSLTHTWLENHIPLSSSPFFNSLTFNTCGVGLGGVGRCLYLTLLFSILRFDRLLRSLREQRYYNQVLSAYRASTRCMRMMNPPVWRTSSWGGKHTLEVEMKERAHRGFLKDFFHNSWRIDLIHWGIFFFLFPACFSMAFQCSGRGKHIVATVKLLSSRCGVWD